MNRLNISKKLGLRALVVTTALAAAAAQALPQVNGTFGFIPGAGPTFSPGTDIQFATTVVLPAVEVVNTIPATYNGFPNDFAPYLTTLVSPVTVAPLSITFPNGPFPAFLTFGPSGRFTFDETATAVTRAPGTLSVLMVGLFKDSGGTFADTAADVSFAFTQSHPGGSVNVSFTFSAPPQHTIPDGGTSVALLGFALVAVEGLRRKLHV